MSRTPDAFDGPSFEEAVIWEEQPSDPTEPRATQYVQGKGLVIMEDGVVHGIGEGRASHSQPPVDDRDVDTPPIGPSAGDRVIVGDSPTGDFSGHSGEIAHWSGSAWVFTTPSQGTITYVKDEGQPYKQTAASTPWVWELVAASTSAFVPRSEWLQNGFPDETEVDISWNDATRTLTLSPSVTSFRYLFEGVTYTETGSLTETITDTDGLWVFYIDGEASLSSLHAPTHAQSDDVILNNTIVAFVMWDATNNDGRLMVELHGSRMSPVTHHYLHETVGMAYFDGMGLGDFTIGSGANNVDAQFSVSAGTSYDEDRLVDQVAAAVGAGLEIWYLDGSNWRWTTVPGYSVLNYSGGSGLLAYNSSGAQVEVGNNDFVLCHIFATNITDDNGANPKYIAIQGQAEYTTLTRARDGADIEIETLEFSTLPLPELLPVATVIFQTNTGYANAVKARVVQTSSGGNYVDWRTANIKGITGLVNDHGALGGLADDDHQHYLLVDGTRAMSGSLDMGGQAISNVGNVDGRDVSADGSTLDTHVGDTTGNPHNVTAAQVGTADGIDSSAIHDDTAAEISAITEKATPVSADLLIIEDSADSYNKKRVQVGNLPGGSGGGDTISVNGSATASTNVDLDDATPAAPAGEVNVKWQKDALSPTNVSASVQASSESQKGVIEIATQAETNGGTDDTRVVTPLKLASTNVAGIDSMAIHDNVSAEISAITEKASPVNADLLLIEDSADSNSKKRLQISNLLSLIDSSQYFSAYDSTGGTNIVSGWTDVPLDTERKKTSDFTHTASSAEVTIGRTDTYIIAATVSVYLSAGTSRSESQMQVLLDTGSGYTLIPGTQLRIYQRQSTEGAGSGTKVFVLDLDSGDKLKIQARRLSGTSTSLLLAGSELCIFTTRGPKGDTGPAGSGGITESEHFSLDTIVHEIAEASYDEVTYTSGKITNYTVWTNSGKTLKIREYDVTYSGNNVSTVVTKQYDGAGTIEEQTTETYGYTGNSVTSVARVKDV